MSANPLVAAPVDTATATSGTMLVDDVVTLAGAIREGDWLEAGLTGVAAAADAISTAIDPVGTLIAWGVGWLLDHVDPLKGWLNDLTGDAGAVIGFAQTWDNVARALGAEAQAFAQRVSGDLAGMSGAAVAAYAVKADRLARTAGAIATAAGAVSAGLRLASMVVQFVHDLVRDTISQVIGSCTSAILWAATGVGIPYAISVVSEKAVALSAKISAKIGQLLRSVLRLKGVLSKLDDLIRSLVRDVRAHLPAGPGRVRLSDGSAHRPQYAAGQLPTSEASRLSVIDSLHDPDLFARHGIDPPWTRDDLIDAISTPPANLTPAQRDCLNEIRDRIGLPGSDGVVQKVLPPNQAQQLIDDGAAGVPGGDAAYGFVTHAPDTAHLGTPREIYDNLALGYSGTPFDPAMPSVPVVRGPLDNGSLEIPRDPVMGGSYSNAPPYTGNGFAGAPDDIVPEARITNPRSNPATWTDGSEMWRLGADGTETLVAVLRNGTWVAVR